MPVLRELLGGERSMRELSNALAEKLRLSESELLEELPSGRGVTVLHSRVGWAKTYMKQAGLVAQPRRGVVALTQRGREVASSGRASIDSRFLRQYEEFIAFQSRSRRDETQANGLTGVAADDATPEERLQEAYKALQAGLSVELLDRLRVLPPARFEALIVDLLLALGFGGGRRGERIGMSGDGGVDGIIREDALGLDVVYIQAKRYAATQAVGPEAIQAFAGSLLERGATKGVFATTSRFTDGAKRAAERLSTQRRLVLIDGDELARLMIEHGVGVRTAETLRIQRLDLSPYEDDA